MMSPKELLGLDACDLEKMSQVELEKIFSPLFHLTRPEYQGRSAAVDGPIQPPPKKLSKSQNQQVLLAKAKELAKQHGIDLQL